MDVVWQMTVTQATGAVVLSRTKGRQGWIPASVTIHRRELADGTVKHVLFEEPAEDWLEPIIANLERFKIDPALSGSKALVILKENHAGAHKSRVMKAVTTRRHRLEAQKTGSQKVRTTLFDENGNQGQNQSEPPSSYTGTGPGTGENPPVLGRVPSIGRNHPDGSPENDSSDPLETLLDPDPQRVDPAFFEWLKTVRAIEEPFDPAEDFEPEPDDLPEEF